MQPLTLIGLNHTTAPVALRERLYMGPHRIASVIADVMALPGVEECAVLSTCNRTEVIQVGGDAEIIVDLFASYAEISVSVLKPHLYLFIDSSALTHLFTVACGLDSLVIGETQILKQVRDALDAARGLGAAGRVLIGVFEQALATGKRARTETAISDGAFSIGRAGVEMARTLFPNLVTSPVLILGAGKMSELTARHLAASGTPSIFVANRTFAHAEALAHQLGGEAIHYDALHEMLTRIDILISSTSAPHHVLHAEEVARIMAKRHGRPLCLIDIAVPRDIDPACAAIPQVHLVNIDELLAVTEENRRMREREIPCVEAIIVEEAERCWQRLAGQGATDAIVALRQSFDRIRRAELARMAPMLAELAPEQSQAIEAMTNAMINKLLHTPTVRLKEMVALRPERRPQDLLCELFIPTGSSEEVTQ